MGGLESNRRGLLLFRYPVDNWIRRSGPVANISRARTPIIRLFLVSAAGPRSRSHDIHGGREPVDVEVQTSCGPLEITEELIKPIRILKLLVFAAAAMLLHFVIVLNVLSYARRKAIKIKT